MNAKEIINQVKSLLEDINGDGIFIFIDNETDNIEMLTRGDEVNICECIMNLVGTDSISSRNLSFLAAYCLAKANGLASFKNPINFADHLMNYAQVYAEIDGDNLSS